MKACLRLPGVCLLSLMAACGPHAAPPAATTGTNANEDGSAARVGTSIPELEASVARMEAAGLHARLVAAAAELLAGGDGKWRLLDDWALRVSELEYYETWCTPDPAREGRVPALDFEAADHSIRFIEATAKDLAAHGIELLVVPIPTRTQVYPDRLPGIESVPDDFAGVDLGYAHFTLELARRGVSVIDLLTPMARQRHDKSARDDERLFHDYDAHWTPRGIEIAADAIADALRAYPWFEAGPARAGRDFMVIEERGDWRFQSIPAELRGIKEPVSLWFRHVRALDRSPAPVESRTSPILLMGDSFVAHLAEASSDIVSMVYARTGHPIDVISIPHGGARPVWAAVARRRDKLEGKRVIIWLASAPTFATRKLKLLDLFGE